MLAVVLDLALGDPRWLPHPVRAIGWLAARTEALTRRLLAPAKLAGVVAALTVYAAAGGAAWGVLRGASWLHPVAGDTAAVLIIYTTIAAQDLARHSMAVFHALTAGDLAAG